MDYVLNSFSGDQLLASIRCLALDGVMLEIRQSNISNDSNIDKSLCSSFRSVVLENVFHQTRERSNYIHGLIERDITMGIIQPLESTVFQMDEIAQAFGVVSTGQQIGKVLLQMRPNGDEDGTVAIRSMPIAYFAADKVYIILGGLGGLGLELANWMVLRGARLLVLSSSRGLSSQYQSYRMR